MLFFFFWGGGGFAPVPWWYKTLSCTGNRVNRFIVSTTVDCDAIRRIQWKFEPLFFYNQKQSWKIDSNGISRLPRASADVIVQDKASWLGQNKWTRHFNTLAFFIMKRSGLLRGREKIKTKRFCLFQHKSQAPSAWNWWSRRPTIHRLLEPPTPLWTSLNKQIKKKKNYLYIPKSQLKVLAPFRVDVTAVLGQDWAILCVLGSTGRRGPLSFFIIFRKSTANKNDGRCSYAKKRPDPLANWPLIFQQKIAWRCNSLRIDA